MRKVDLTKEVRNAHIRVYRVFDDGMSEPTYTLIKKVTLPTMTLRELITIYHRMYRDFCNEWMSYSYDSYVTFMIDGVIDGECERDHSLEKFIDDMESEYLLHDQFGHELSFE